MHVAIMKASIFTPYRGRWGLPILFWGPPGAAKTAAIEELCEKFGIPYETLSPSERGEGAFGVVPVPNSPHDIHASHREDLLDKLASGKEKLSVYEAAARAEREFPRPEPMLTYPRPEWTEKFAKEGRGVVFVDEVTSTAPALQAPLMGLVLARRIGGYRLPPGVRIIAAANPPEIAAGGFDLSPPLANRFGHLDWAPPTEEEHVQYMLRGSSGLQATKKLLKEIDEDAGEDSVESLQQPELFDVDAEERRVMKAWPEAWARAVGLETAFIRARPALKNVLPKEGDAKIGRSWPSDRTWDFATHAFASGIVHTLAQAEREVFVEGFIGTGVAQEWFEFMEKQDLPDPAKLLDGKEKFKHDSTRIDRTVAVLQACVALVAPKAAAKRTDRTTALWGVLEKMTEDKADLDLVIPSVHALIQSDLHAMKAANRTLALVNPVLRKAGVQPGRF